MFTLSFFQVYLLGFFHMVSIDQVSTRRWSLDTEILEIFFLSNSVRWKNQKLKKLQFFAKWNTLTPIDSSQQVVDLAFFCKKFFCLLVMFFFGFGLAFENWWLKKSKILYWLESNFYETSTFFVSSLWYFLWIVFWTSSKWKIFSCWKNQLKNQFKIDVVSTYRKLPNIICDVL